MNFMTKIGLIIATVVIGCTVYFFSANQSDGYHGSQPLESSEIFHKVPSQSAGQASSDQSLDPSTFDSEKMVAQEGLELNAQAAHQSGEHLDNEPPTIEGGSVELQSSPAENFKENLCANQGESRCLIYDVTQVENELIVSEDTMHLNKAMVVLDSQNLEELIDYMNATASIAEQEYTEKFNQRLASMTPSEVSVSPIACGEKICFLTMTYQQEEVWQNFAEQLFFGDDSISYNIGQKPQKIDENGYTEVRYFFSYDPNLRRFISI